MRINYTRHAREQMAERNISEQDVIDAIKMPDRITKEHGKYYASKNIGLGTIEAAYEIVGNYIKVITVYWV